MTRPILTWTTRRSTRRPWFRQFGAASLLVLAAVVGAWIYWEGWAS